MVNAEEIRNLKIKLLENLEKIDKKQQYGLEIHIEYDYLLNVDLNWIIEEIRKSIISALDIKPKRQEYTLTFRIHQISTEHSIFLLIIIGIVSTAIGGLVKDYLKDLIRIGYKKFKERVENGKVSIDRRDNLHQLTLKPFIIEENKIIYDEKEKPITIKRNDNIPKWIRF